MIDRLKVNLQSRVCSHLREGDGVEVDNAKDLLVRLQTGGARLVHALLPSPDGAEVIAQVEGSGRLYA